MKIDGKQIANKILEDLKIRVNKLKKKDPSLNSGQAIYPKLAIVQVGNDPSSAVYVNQKKIKAELIGAEITVEHFPSGASTSALLDTIQKFNNNQTIHGIVVQHPLRQDINLRRIINAINPEKDVDGFRSDSHFQMPIAMAVLKILEKVYISTPEIQSRFVDWLKNKKIAVIGKGETGGKPIKNLFEKMKIPYVVIDSKTKNPEKLTKKADIVISAVGKTNILKPQMIKKGVVIIGVGISRGKSARLTGDYDQDKIKNIASFYTPTPGGIGPINVAMLLKNLVAAAEKLI